ncbi:MAG: septum formation inhibitor Maf [Gammaproteobacteria bacterium]|nr:septum formation inhibitor Maf [Gammaproteobacteria bacterium]
MTTPDASVYLASLSPRRQELLQQIGVSYELLPVNVDETPADDESAEDYVQRLALAKARAGWSSLAGKKRLPVLGADTVVFANGALMGKPRDRQQANAMLQALSGSTHEVLTAVALAFERSLVRLNISRVTFRTLSLSECEAYWDTGEPADKAGAYAIQGLGAAFITHLEGSYSGVMGLPLFETAELLQESGIRLLNPA